MQRGGQPEEVANAILWLLSEEASYVTGAILMYWRKVAVHNKWGQ